MYFHLHKDIKNCFRNNLIIFFLAFNVLKIGAKYTSCREEGIRTLDTLLAYTHFPGVRLRPLGHLSI